MILTQMAKDRALEQLRADLELVEVNSSITSGTVRAGLISNIKMIETLLVGRQLADQSLLAVLITTYADAPRAI